MKKVYNSCNIEVDLPSDWKILDDEQVERMGINNQPGVELLDVYLKEFKYSVGIISFQNFGKAEGFIETMDSYLNKLTEKFNKAEEEGKSWKTILPVKPLDHRIISVNNKKIYAIAYESATNEEDYVIQINFLFNKNTYCLTFNVEKSTFDLDKILNEDILAKDCIEFIMSATKC